MKFLILSVRHFNFKCLVITLTECVKYFSKINDIENNLSGVSFGFTNYSLNDEMSSQKVRKIALMLAKAIDENSVEKIKELKKQYGHEREFATAKKFLDKKCKEIWDVFEFKKIKLKIPHAAMKSLGITNQPTAPKMINWNTTSEHCVSFVSIEKFFKKLKFSKWTLPK